MNSAYFEVPNSGTQDDDDNRDDEHADENEAPIREVNDQTEAPEEFKIDDEDETDDQRPAGTRDRTLSSNAMRETRTP
jgi:hypothetical protein